MDCLSKSTLRRRICIVSVCIRRVVDDTSRRRPVLFHARIRVFNLVHRSDKLANIRHGKDTGEWHPLNSLPSAILQHSRNIVISPTRKQARTCFCAYRWSRSNRETDLRHATTLHCRYAFACLRAVYRIPYSILGSTGDHSCCSHMPAAFAAAQPHSGRAVVLVTLIRLPRTEARACNHTSLLTLTDAYPGHRGGVTPLVSCHDPSPDFTHSRIHLSVSESQLTINPSASSSSKRPAADHGRGAIVSICPCHVSMIRSCHHVTRGCVRSQLVST